MSWAKQPIEAKGQRVCIRNYQLADVPKISEAIHDPNGWFGLRWGLDTPAKISDCLLANLKAQAKATDNPLLYLADHEIAGITRLMRIDPANKALEIGGTWVAPKWRKSFVNTEVKYLLLKHCFEELLAERIEFRVDARNIESFRAVLRIGAKLEGQLRNRQVYPDGTVSDGFLFSVVRPEWSEVREHLERLLDLSREGDVCGAASSCDLVPKTFPNRIETNRFILRRYELEDADSLWTLIEKNRAGLVDDFPLTLRELASRAKTDTFILSKLQQWYLRTMFCYAVFHKETGQHMGQFQIKNIKWEIPSAEFGYFLDREIRHKGYGTEILSAAVELCLGKMNMERVYLRILPTNLPSLRLAEKLNFDCEGLHRKDFLTGAGKLDDIYYFSKTRRSS